MENVQKKHYNLKYWTISLIFGAMMLFLTACSSMSAGNGNKVDGIQVQNGDYASAIETANIGDIFIIGACEQDNNSANGDEPIQWRVLDKNENGVLLISEHILEYGAYDYDGGDITWRDCGTRESWNDFRINKMFTEDEIKHIAWANVENSSNTKYGIDGGSNTRDRLFLLSVDEVTKYFSEDEDRCATPTEYAKSDAIGTISETEYKWWLRTPGEDASRAVYVSEVGTIEMSGDYVSESDEIGDRPAMWLMKQEQVDLYGAAELSYAKIEEATVGDLVLYGTYEQDGDEDTKEPIEWVVLSREDDKVLLLSRYILEKLRFGSTPYWESSEIRNWLNGEFYNSAFNADEKKKIQRMVTSDKTDDLIFCLSAEEARGLFDTDEERIAYITDYLLTNGFKDEGRRTGDWWTRSVSQATNGSGVVPVEMDGNVRSAGTNPCAPEEYTYVDVGVRPAICINLSEVDTNAVNMTVFGYDSNHDLDNEIRPSGGTGNNSSGKCPNCGGSGVVKYYYGSSDLEAYLSGHDAYELGECPMCDGTGR